MKVMYVTARPPYPPHKGDQLIAYEQLKQLQELKHKIYVVTFVDEMTESSYIYDHIKDYCEALITIPINKRDKMIGACKTVFNGKPLQINMFKNSQTQKIITQLYRNISPDIIHVQTTRMTDYFLHLHAPKVVDMIDALSLNMKRRAERENIVKAIAFRIEGILMKLYEKRVLKAYNKTLLVSAKDKEYLQDKDVVVNPNGTYITREHLKNYQGIEKEKIILFHGNMQYFPNVEAMMYFTKEIWPSIHKLYSDYRLFIVGKDPEAKIKELNGNQNIVVTGFVDDICPYLLRATLGVYPLRSGTGMQNKILEAQACGLPIVASARALQGIEGISEDEVYIAETNEEMIKGISELIEKSDLRKRLGEKSQTFVLENYSWQKNVRTLHATWVGAIYQFNQLKEQ
ncbi:glycosyltransferase family 4 protein [Bacillus timonensis]|nr:glycosyltransferase family 4 protein [Bacillus timonensis]